MWGAAWMAPLLVTRLAAVQSQESCAWNPTGSAIEDRRIYDLTAPIGPHTVNWDSADGLGDIRELMISQEKGDPATASLIKRLPAHTATHVDAPGHFVLEEYKKGFGVDKLSLQALNGPALVVESTADSNITADVLSSLNIPPGIRRLIFKTANTAKRLMHQTQFDSSYTGMTADGAQWLVEHLPGLQLVGIDYTSVAIFEDLPGAHNVLLPRHVVIVEGLVLDELQAGLYNINCLPLKLEASDGAPINCIATWY